MKWTIKPIRVSVIVFNSYKNVDAAEQTHKKQRKINCFPCRTALPVDYSLFAAASPNSQTHMKMAQETRSSNHC